MKKIFILILLFLVFMLNSCDIFYSYKGNDYDLFTVAMNSVLDSHGHTFKDNEGPTLYIIEEDNYGRKLFYYCEGNNISTHSLIISQKTFEGNVYYFPDYNFISNSNNEFSDEEINNLKVLNDWNLPLNEEKMVISNIIYNKEDREITNDELIEKIISDNYSNQIDEFALRHCCIWKTDANGISLVVVRMERKSEIKNFLIFLDSEMKFIENRVYYVEDYYNYQNWLKKIKMDIGWVD